MNQECFLLRKKKSMKPVFLHNRTESVGACHLGLGCNSSVLTSTNPFIRGGVIVLGVGTRSC